MARNYSISTLKRANKGDLIEIILQMMDEEKALECKIKTLEEEAKISLNVGAVFKEMIDKSLSEYSSTVRKIAMEEVRNHREIFHKNWM